ncbi:MAG TPA: NUDIX hydrolase [Dysgonomonas sp.]|nr:NUDIX hydrolase [Dysgonomonas sp.]
MQHQKTVDNNNLSELNNILTVNLVVGNVIFAFHEEVIKILLVKRKGTSKWMLPWAFVLLEEGADETAYKLVKEKTNLDEFHISQFHLFGKYDRFDYEKHCKLLSLMGYDPKGSHSFLRYTAFMGYYVFVRYDDVAINKETEIEEIEWFDIHNVPDLYFEHNEVIEKSFLSIKQRIGYLPLAFALLPEKFTMPEMRIIYEKFLGYELDRRNFQRKILSTGLITKLEEKKKKGAHKSPYLYSFNTERYMKALENDEQLMAWTFQ